MSKDRIVAIAAVLLGGAYLVAAFRVPVVEAADDTGPRAFPFLIAALVIGSGLLLLAKELRSGARPRDAWRPGGDRGVWARIALTAGAGIAYGLLLDPLGYLLATFLFMWAMAAAINVGRHAQNVALAAGFSLVSFVAFGVLLKLSIPRGVLGAFLPF